VQTSQRNASYRLGCVESTERVEGWSPFKLFAQLVCSSMHELSLTLDSTAWNRLGNEEYIVLSSFDMKLS